MQHAEEREERQELISRMFALLTAKLEDVAAIAADCQGRLSPERLLKGAMELQDLASETAIIAAAATALLLDSSATTHADDQ